MPLRSWQEISTSSDYIEATPEQQAQIRAAYDDAIKLVEKNVEMSHLRSQPAGGALSGEEQLRLGISQQYGLPLAESDPTNAVPIMDRPQYGLSTLPGEIAEQVTKKYPDADVRIIDAGDDPRVVFRRGEEQPQVVNPVGLDWGDVTSLFGQEGPVAAGVYAGGKKGAELGSRFGPVGAAAGGLGGAFIGGLGGAFARQGAESFVGEQQQPIMPMSGREGVVPPSVVGEGVTQTIGEMVGRGLGPKVRGGVDRIANLRRKGFTSDDRKREHLLRIKLAQDTGLDLEEPLLHQIMDSMILDRLSSQAGSTGKRIPNILAQQDSAAVEAIRSTVKDLSDMSVEELSQALLRTNKASFKRQQREIMGDYRFAYPTRAGKKTREIFTDWLKSEKKGIREMYREVDQVATDLKAFWDLTPIQDFRERAGIAIMAPAKIDDDALAKAIIDGDTEGLIRYINVAESPGGQLSRAISIVEQLNPTQSNWKVLREIRGRVGRMLQEFPTENTRELGIADQFFREISDIYKNPTSTVGDPSDFKRAVEAANARTYNYYDIQRKNRTVGRVLDAARNEPELVDHLWKNPQAWNEEFINILRSDSAKAKELRDVIRARVLRQEKGMEEFMRAANDYPERMRFLVPRADRAVFEKARVNMQRLHSSEMMENLDKVGSHLDVAWNALTRPGLGPGDVEYVLKAYGGKGSRGHQLLRTASWERFLRDVTKQNPSGGGDMLDLNKVSSTIRNMQETGVWDRVLTHQDRVRMEALESFAVISKRKKDTGTSLEQAAAIANLKHPSTFVSGIHAIGANRILSIALTSKTLSKPAWAMAVGLPSGRGKSRLDMGSAELWRNIGQITAAVVHSSLNNPSYPQYDINNPSNRANTDQ